MARFLSVDPLRSQFPWLTPYQFASNRPIVAIDLDGLESADTQGEEVGSDPNEHEYDFGQQLPTQEITATQPVSESGKAYQKGAGVAVVLMAAVVASPEPVVTKTVAAVAFTAAALYIGVSHFVLNQDATTTSTYEEEVTRLEEMERYRPERPRPVAPTVPLEDETTELYRLNARNSGWYPCGSCTEASLNNPNVRLSQNAYPQLKYPVAYEIYLNQDELWKYGITAGNEQSSRRNYQRYPANWLTSLRMRKETLHYFNNRRQALDAERDSINIYHLHYENIKRGIPTLKPAGNL